MGLTKWYEYASSLAAQYWAFQFLHVLLKPSSLSTEDEVAASSSPKSPNENQLVIAWHPHRMLLAVAQADGQINFFDQDNNKWDGGLILFHQFHRNVSVMQWKPRSRSVLAVGVMGGVCIWDCEQTLQAVVGNVPSGGAGLPSQSLPDSFYSKDRGVMWFVRHPDEVAVHTLDFTTNGDLLAFGSRDSCQTLVYDTSLPPTHPKAIVQTLFRAQGGTSLVRWSKSGQYLFITSPARPSYTIYDSTCSFEKWHFTSNNVIQHALWGQNDILCLAEANSLDLTFLKISKTGPALVPVPLATVHVPHSISSTPSATRSSIRLLAWDSNSAMLLAVTPDGLVHAFTTQEHAQPFYSLHIHQQGAVPMGPTSTPSAASPVCLAFSSHIFQKATASVAALRWSDGSLCAYPFQFTPLGTWESQDSKLVKGWKWKWQ